MMPMRHSTETELSMNTNPLIGECCEGADYVTCRKVVRLGGKRHLMNVACYRYEALLLLPAYRLNEIQRSILLLAISCTS